MLKKILDPMAAFFLGGIQILTLFFKRNVLGESLPNFNIVKGSKIFRGGQPSQHGMRKLVKEGVAIIVNLRSRNGDEKMLSKVFKGKIDSIHVPIMPFYPTDSAVIAFLKIFQTIKNKFVYVHCFHGADRTGLMCAMYRIIYDGWDKSRAIDEMRENGFHFWHRKILAYIENSDVEYLRKEVFAVN